MNANADLSSLAETIERLRADCLPPAVCAKATGHAVSTISRDRVEKPLLDWKARDVLLLARVSPELTNALRAYLDGREPPQGSATDLNNALAADIRAVAQVEIALRDSLADNELRVREIDRIRRFIAIRIATARRIDADLRAARRTAKP